MITNTHVSRDGKSDIPDSWNIFSLGEIADTISDTYHFSDQKVIFLNTSDIYEGKVLHTNESNPEILPGQAKKRIKKNDILFSEIRPANRRFALIDFDTPNYVVSTKLMVLRSRNMVLPKYLYNLLTFPKTLSDFQMFAESRSGTFPQITFQEVSSYQFLIPPLDEQQKINDFVSAIQIKIELNRKMNKTLEEIGKALFLKLIYSENSDTEISELSQFVNINPKESLKKQEILRYVEMKDLPTEGMWCYTNVIKPYRGGSKFRNGDSILARITPCLENGKSGYINFLNSNELAFGSTEFIVFRPKDVIYEEFIYYLVRDENFRDYAIKSMVGSSGRQRVQTDAIIHYQLHVPRITEIKSFHELLNPIFNLIKSNSFEIEYLSSVRDLLLPRLISGKIRIN